MKIRSYINKVVTELVDKFYVHEIRKDPENIYNMVDPSAKVIIALAERAPELMSYVKEDHADKLTDEVKQEIAKNNPDIVLMFPDDKKLTSYVLKNHGDRLSEDAKFSIVAQDPSFIGCIQNPSERLQTIAVFKDYKCITLIDNPCEFAQRFAVDQDPFVLSLIEPNENICLYAVTKDPHNIKFISEPSDKVLFVATNLSPKCAEIVSSENLAEEVKLSLSASSNSVVAVEKIFNINSNTKIEQLPNILSEKDIEKSNNDKMSISL